MKDLLKEQKQRYIEGCARMRVERRLGKLNDYQYQDEMLKLARNCQEFLMGDIEEHIGMYREIKTRTDQLEQQMGM